MRTLLAILVLSFAGCATQSQPSGSNGFQSWTQRALAHPNENAVNHRFYLAYHGKPEGLHAYFAEALRQAESPELDVEAGEGFSSQVQTIIHQIGDDRFAAAFAAEPSRVRSAMASCFSEVASPVYPKTLRLMKAAPKIDFPMLKTSRGDYHPSVLKA